VFSVELIIGEQALTAVCKFISYACVLTANYLYLPNLYKAEKSYNSTLLECLAVSSMAESPTSSSSGLWNFVSFCFCKIVNCNYKNEGFL